MSNDVVLDDVPRTKNGLTKFSSGKIMGEYILSAISKKVLKEDDTFRSIDVYNLLKESKIIPEELIIPSNQITNTSWCGMAYANERLLMSSISQPMFVVHTKKGDNALVCNIYKLSQVGKNDLNNLLFLGGSTKTTNNKKSIIAKRFGMRWNAISKKFVDPSQETINIPSPNKTLSTSDGMYDDIAKFRVQKLEELKAIADLYLTNLDKYANAFGLKKKDIDSIIESQILDFLNR